ncbi:hypothetical protein HN51_020022 [Arachis hypogaea]
MNSKEEPEEGWEARDKLTANKGVKELWEFAENGVSRSSGEKSRSNGEKNAENLASGEIIKEVILRISKEKIRGNKPDPLKGRIDIGETRLE